MSPHKSLRTLFENDIKINHISEELQFCNVDDEISKAKHIMEKNQFDCIGIEENENVVGYLEYKNIDSSAVSCREKFKYFDTTEIVSETTSLINTLFLLEKKERIFILEGNRVNKLVTIADLQKPPIQLLLFGLISLTEMSLLQIIKYKYPNDTWENCLNEARLEQAKLVFDERQKLNEEMELIDCLQLCDKRDIALKNDKIRLFLFESKNKGNTFLKKLERLRNNLAHAQKFTENFTVNEIVSLVRQTEKFLGKSECFIEKELKSVKSI